MGVAEFDAFVTMLVEEEELRLKLSEEVLRLTKALEECQQPPEAPGRGCFGFYRGGITPKATYEAAEVDLGRPIDHILTFTPQDSWADIALPLWWRNAFKADRNPWAADYGTIVSLPLCPTGATVASVDPVALAEAFTLAGSRLVAAGLHRSYLRIGWESQGGWYPWTATKNPRTYAGRFRDAVTALRSAAGQEFRIDWNIAGGKPITLDGYPGDDYVDVISVDLYGNAPNPWAILDETHQLALGHGKAWAVTEWGVWGADQPAFVDLMAAYLDTHPHAYQHYFDVNSSADHRLASWPKTRAAYLAWAPDAVCRPAR